MSTRRNPEVVVVTGAGAGLGRAIVQSFARRGAHVGLVARSEKRLEDTRREVEQLGGKALVLPGDVADPATSENAAARTEAEFGPIDVWVNDAMTTVFLPFHEMSAEDFKRVTEVTYLGFVYGTMAALKRMRARNRGTIVQVGSALAYRSIPLQSAYCGAKHAIVGFTDSIRTELIHDGSRVHITVVQMPALNTPQFSWCKSNMPRQAQPVPPIFQPEVGAQAVYWAAHQRHREVFVGWPTARAIWGQRMIPGILDHLAARMAWDGQLSDGAPDPERPVDLYYPVPGHQAAHGAFDDRARGSSWELKLTMQASRLASALSGAAGGLMRSPHAALSPTESDPHSGDARHASVRAAVSP
ncbi:MAG: SDR family oxidoreductase [Chloroflexota bacterium]|nr:SDR family oxidoreductase [Chloroflexota bacterium]